MERIENGPGAATLPEPETTRNRWSWLGTAGLVAVPLVLLAAVLAWILATDGGLPEQDIPPIETLNVQRVVLPDPGQIEIHVINDGPDTITIAQVLVDEAFWQFTMEPGTSLDRLESAVIRIPYPWVRDEAHAITMLSSTGVAFEADVPVAIESPSANSENFWRFALIGLYVGVVPVGLGLLWYPALRRLGRRGMNAILALTVGLLVFLAFDMWNEAHEVALGAAGAFNLPVLIPVLAIATAGLLAMIGHTLSRRGGPDRGLPVAYQVATGIGLHNLGEGLAIGAAFAIGEVALGVFLIVGFTLHNVTEGVGIAAPLVRDRPPAWHFASLAAIAGAPAILGTWIGAFTYSPVWITVFLAVGIGALVQVIVEVGRLVVRSQRRAQEPWLTWPTFGGFAAGLALMYATALLVAA